MENLYDVYIKAAKMQTEKFDRLYMRETMVFLADFVCSDRVRWCCYLLKWLLLSRIKVRNLLDFTKHTGLARYKCASWISG